jgi:hypothetical protein
VYLRQHYHFGPRKIADYLKRFHQIAVAGSSVHRILCRQGMSRLYQFTAIHDCTRIRVLEVYDACNQATAIRFVDEVRRRLPFRIRVIQTDNGAEFQSRSHWHLEAWDIRHVYRAVLARDHLPCQSRAVLPAAKHREHDGDSEQRA